jgi:phenylpyruvate tautomerase PptA (4-oxalocrotonate tautomerase family)
MPAMKKHRLSCMASVANNALTLDHRCVHMVWCGWSRENDMKNDSSLRRTIQLAAAVTAVWLATTGAVGAQVSVVSVAVFADHYVLGGRYIDDLDELVVAIATARPRGVRIEACGEDASRAFRAAAHRFRNFYLDLRTAGIDDTACQPASAARAVPVSQRLGQGPFNINDEAVDRWWSTLSMP